MRSQCVPGPILAEGSGDEVYLLYTISSVKMIKDSQRVQCDDMQVSRYLYAF